MAFGTKLIGCHVKKKADMAPFFIPYQSAIIESYQEDTFLKTLSGGR